MGKSYEEEILPMNTLNIDLGYVSVEGEIFAVNHREIESRNLLILNFDITDQTSSLRVSRAMDTEEAQRRAELLVDVQSRIIDWYNEETLGQVLEILCEGFDPQAQMYVGRSYGESPDIDGRVYFTADGEIMAGTFVPVRITGVMDGELTGELWEVEA